MADIYGMMDALQHRAAKRRGHKRKASCNQKRRRTVQCICRVCRELGYEIYEMELICAGEEFHAEMKRSTNGGGENSPKLEGRR